MRNSDNSTQSSRLACSEQSNSCKNPVGIDKTDFSLRRLGSRAKICAAPPTRSSELLSFFAFQHASLTISSISRPSAAPQSSLLGCALIIDATIACTASFSSSHNVPLVDLLHKIRPHTHAHCSPSIATTIIVYDQTIVNISLHTVPSSAMPGRRSNAGVSSIRIGLYRNPAVVEDTPPPYVADALSDQNCRQPTQSAQGLQSVERECSSPALQSGRELAPLSRRAQEVEPAQSFRPRESATSRARAEPSARPVETTSSAQPSSFRRSQPTQFSQNYQHTQLAQPPQTSPSRSLSASPSPLPRSQLRLEIQHAYAHGPSPSIRQHAESMVSQAAQRKRNRTSTSRTTRDTPADVSVIDDDAPDEVIEQAAGRQKR